MSLSCDLPSRKGDTFTRLSKSGKWIEVESRDGSEKGWIIWMAHKLKY